MQDTKEKDVCIYVLLFGSVDFDRNPAVVFRSRGAHNQTDRLSDASLLADNPSHIVFSHMEMVNDGAVLRRLIGIHTNLVRLFHQATSNAKQQLFQISHLRDQSTSFFLNRAFTVSVG